MLRGLLPFTVLASLIWLLAVLAKTREPIPKLLPYYVVWTALYAVGAWVMCNKVRADEYFYAAFYFFMLGISLFLALVLTAQLLNDGWSQTLMALAVALVVHFLYLKKYIVPYLKEHEDWWYVSAVMVLQSFLIPIGILALTSALRDGTPAGVAVRVVIGAYLIAQGVWALFYVTGTAVENNRSLWEAAGDYVPHTFGILAFSTLALALSRMDSEGAREALPAFQVAERLAGR